MLTTLRSRLDKEEDGFTLIELMVVVLIIGILIAIAIPAFLGAQNRAQDRAAQTNLRNAMTNARAVFTDTGAYQATAAMVTTLQAAEPNLTMMTAAPTERNDIAVITNGGNTIVMTARSQSGQCYFIRDVAGATTQPAPTGTCAPSLTHSAT